METHFKNIITSISRWSEQLVVYPRTNKQNQKKKRKVEPTTSQVVLLIRKVNISSFHCF